MDINEYKLDTRETILATGSGNGVKYHIKDEELWIADLETKKPLNTLSKTTVLKLF